MIWTKRRDSLQGGVAMVGIYYNVVFAISLNLLCVYVYLWHKHFDTRLSIIFAFVTIACLGYKFSYEAVELKEYVLAVKIIYIGGCFLPYLMLAYILELCKIEVKKWLKVVVFIACSLEYLSVITIGYFPLFYKKIFFESTDGEQLILKEYGIMHTMFYVLSLAFLVNGIISIIYSYRRKEQIPRKMLALMMIPYVVSFILYFVTISGSRILELTPIGYLLFEIILLFVAYRMLLYDINDSVIESMIQKGDTGLISFDYDYRYLGSNEMAKKIFPFLSDLKIDAVLSQENKNEKKLLHWISSFAFNENNEFVYTVKDDDDNETFYNINVDNLFDGRNNRGYIITIVDDTDRRKYIQLLDNYNEQLVKEVEKKAKRIEKIMEERKKVEAELELAANIQSSALPNVFPAFPEKSEFDLYATMNPAKEVGGDFYDFFLIDDDHLCMVIADVSGKGIPASLFMMTSKTTISNEAMHEISPEIILTRANEAICANNKMDMFVTVWLGVLEISTGKLTAANAGHEYPFIKKNGKFAVFKDKHGMAVGVMDGLKYKEYSVDLEPGDFIFVYTDGVAEANNKSKELFGLDRIQATLDGDKSDDCKEIIKGIRTSIDVFADGAQQFDDITMLCLKYNG